MAWEQWLLFVFATFFISATPGPNMLLAFQYGINYGVKKTFYALLGLSAGLLILLGVSALTVSVVSQKAPLAFELAKIAGAAYLLYLAWQSWCSVDTRLAMNAVRIQPSKSRLFRSGLAVALSNPKAILFFASFFPKFLQINMPMAPQYLILIISFFVIETIWQWVYTLSGKTLSTWLQQDSRLLWLNRICGMFFAFIALSLVVDSIQTMWLMA